MSRIGSLGLQEFRLWLRRFKVEVVEGFFLSSLLQKKAKLLRRFRGT